MNKKRFEIILITFLNLWVVITLIFGLTGKGIIFYYQYFIHLKIMGLFNNLGFIIIILLHIIFLLYIILIIIRKKQDFKIHFYLLFSYFLYTAVSVYAISYLITEGLSGLHLFSI